MKKQFFRLTILAAIIAGFSSCEDKIDLDIPAGTSYPVLDAWITDEPGIQTIRFTKSVPYTQQGAAPFISDAKITVYDDTNGEVYPFEFVDSVYQHGFPADGRLGQVGHIYRLRVEYDNNVYEARDTVRRVTTIERLEYRFKKKGTDGVREDGYYVRFFATDEAGATDYSWIRSYRNTTENANIMADVFAIDGGYSENLSDGQEFTQNMGENINDYEHPYLQGDYAIVKLRSLSYPSYFWVTSVQTQLQAGGLFATVLANVGTNLKNVTEGGGKGKILGWFGASAVSVAETGIN